MASTEKIIRIFVASPGDTSREREALPGIINELNRTLRALLPGTNTRLELVRWETHAFPSMGRPQQIINDQIGEYDIFIGILWRRFGTPTGRAESGTKEEFDLAYSNWNEHRRPRILFYFNLEPFSPPKALDEVEQLKKVVAFRESLNSKCLVWEYTEGSQFSAVVRPHLTEVVGELIHSATSPNTEVGTERVLAPQPVVSQAPIGARVEVTAVGPGDGFAGSEFYVIGQIGTLIELERMGQWSAGAVKLDYPFKGKSELYFFQFQYKLLGSEA